jgi:hypothetical protein
MNLKTYREKGVSEKIQPSVKFWFPFAGCGEKRLGFIIKEQSISLSCSASALLKKNRVKFCLFFSFTTPEESV